MKIAWFHSHLLHVNSGGTRFVLDFCEGLQRIHGHEITIFCDVASQAAAEQIRAAGMGLVELDRCSSNAAEYWLTLPIRIWRKRRKLKQVLCDYDFIVSSMFPMSWLVSDCDLPKLQICYEPFAFFHDPGFLQNFKFHHRLFFRLMKFLYARKDRQAIRKMDAVITINAKNAIILHDQYGVKADVIQAGMDTVLYRRTSEEDMRALRERCPGSPLLLHSTDLTGIKGSYPLLDVVAELRKTHPAIKLLVTIYVDDPAGVERFLRRIEALGLTGNVKYLGCLKKTELPRFYSAVDFVCQPSINQPASWPLKEALICGTPIIGGAESEEVIDFVNGVAIDLRDKISASEKLRRAFERGQSFSTAESAEEYISKFSHDRCVGLMNAKIEEITAYRAARRERPRAASAVHCRNGKLVG